MKVKLLSAKVVRWRFYFVLTALLGLTFALVLHLASIQIMPNESRGYEFLQRQGLVRTLRLETIPALRGVITDRHGEPLAISTPVVSLWAQPQEFQLSIDRVAELSEKLSIEPNLLAKKLSRYKNKEFMYLRRHMTLVDSEDILALEIPGISDQREYNHFYQAG